MIRGRRSFTRERKPLTAASGKLGMSSRPAEQAPLQAVDAGLLHASPGEN